MLGRITQCIVSSYIPNQSLYIPHILKGFIRTLSQSVSISKPNKIKTIKNNTENIGNINDTTLKNARDIHKIIEEQRKLIRYYDSLYYSNGSSPISDSQYDKLKQQLLNYENNTSKQELDTDLINSPTRTVGSEYVNNVINASTSKICHDIPMLSLEHVNYSLNLIHWISKIQTLCTRTTNGSSDQNKTIVEFALEPKFDGMAIDLKYNYKGELISTSTRGDGTVGDNITENVLRLVESVPKQLNFQGAQRKLNPGEFVHVRGEVLMKKSQYKQFKEGASPDTVKNVAKTIEVQTARNLGVGLLRRDLNKLTAKEIELLPKLHFQPYSLHLPKDKEQEILFLLSTTHSERMNLLHKWGFVASNIQLFYSNQVEELNTIISNWNSHRRDQYPYELDGLVLKVNSINLQLSLGTDNRAPKYSLAYKFPSQSAITQLINIEYNVGKTGKLAPIAKLKPVLCGGTVIQRATLHNLKFIQNLGLYEGCSVAIERSNDVIPTITAVVNAKVNNSNSNIPVTIPTHCPNCNSELIIKRSNESQDLYCMNVNCSGRNQSKLINYTSKSSMNIENVGESVISTLTQLGIITTLKDFIDLATSTSKQAELRAILSQTDGFGTKKIDKIINSIVHSHCVANSKQILTALQIDSIAKENAKNIIDYCENKGITLLQLMEHENLREMLSEIDGIGDLRVELLIKQFQNEENREIVRKILEFQKILGQDSSNQENTHKNIKLSDKLRNEVIVITGSHSHTRSELSTIIESHGGTVQSTISKRTTILLLSAQEKSLVEGLRSPSDSSLAQPKDQVHKKLLLAAENLGIKLYTEDELLTQLDKDIK